jgi:D-arabinose 1-dehydrogenase-like Zn-dependent alcohol dehydrogenase
MGPLVSGLGTRGKLIVVGVPQDEIHLSAFPLVFGGRSISGSLAGTAIDNVATALTFPSPLARERRRQCSHSRALHR